MAKINIQLSASSGSLLSAVMHSTMLKNLFQMFMPTTYYEHHCIVSVALNWTPC